VGRELTAPESPRLSVDVVPLVRGDDGRPALLLSKRQFEPALGRFALPGVLVIAGESLDEACRRALRSKSGIEPGHIRWIDRTGVYDSPVRDERGPTISISYLAVIDDPEAARRPQNRLSCLPAVPGRLPFDHHRIISEAVAHAAAHLFDHHGRLARAFLGDRFTTSKMVELLSGIDPAFNSTNTHRLLSAQAGLAKGSGAASTGGRAPRVWEWTGR
jgi:8-oxo-dGTP diphosphatase